MKRPTNRYERIAGVFIVLAIVITTAVAVGVVHEKGWLAAKTRYHTYMKTASGIHAGTQIHLYGLKAGWVYDVELIAAGKVKVNFDILNKYKHHVTKDSKMQVIRPFVVGEKVIELSTGDAFSPLVAENGLVPYESGIDVVDLLSGRLLGPMMATLKSIADDMKLFTAAFSEKDISAPLTQLVTQLEPLAKNMNSMSREVAKMAGGLNRNEVLLRSVEGVAAMSGELNQLVKEMNKMMPALAESTPVLAEKIPQLIDNMTVLSGQMKSLTPVVNEVAPQVPGAMKRAVKALDEAVVTMKGFQKSFLLRGKMDDVREELLQENQ